ncbi:hypothetical protein ACSDR0_36695 [Streptosporangium sp. G11]|uniref:hypothetical protein n=1 Tax=Streptosporangium sp. G11 TaxID=3436926 RepID=UPI003EBD0118
MTTPSLAKLTTIARSLRDQGARTAFGHLAPAGRDIDTAWHLISHASTRRP